MLREITFADLDRLEELEKICFLKSPWNKQMLKESISFTNVYKVCLEQDGVIIAYLIAGYNNWEAEIFTIGVDVPYRKQGFARKLLCALKDFCVSLNKEAIFLEVRNSNVSAISLYKNFGFKEISIRKNYYENTEDAIIMELKIDKS